MGSSQTWKSLKFQEWCHLLPRWYLCQSQAIPKMFYLGKFFTEKNLAGMDPGIWAGHGCIQNQEKSNTNRLPVGHWPHVQDYGMSDICANLLWGAFWLVGTHLLFLYLGPRNAVAQLGRFYIVFLVGEHCFLQTECLKKYHKRFLQDLTKKGYHCDETSSSTFTKPHNPLSQKVFVETIN